MAEEVKPSDDIKEMEEAIKKARESLVSKTTEEEIKKAADKAREDALKEAETNKILEEKEKEVEELKAKQLESERRTAEQLEEMKKKMNDLVESKATVNVNDPFLNNNTQPGKVPIKDLTDEQVDDLEEKAARDFFGDTYHIVEKLRRELK